MIVVIVHVIIAQGITAARYVKSEDNESVTGAVYDAESALYVSSIAIISNETVHERNIAFTCNSMLIDIMNEKIPTLKNVYF